MLSNAEGEPNKAIAERLKLTQATVGKWRARFIEQRFAGLYAWLFHSLLAPL